MVLLSIWSQAFPTRKHATSVRNIAFSEKTAGVFSAEPVGGDIGEKENKHDAAKSQKNVDSDSEAEDEDAGKVPILAEEWASSGLAASEARLKGDVSGETEEESSEAAQLIKDFCAHPDLLRVKPTEEDLAAIWLKCLHGNKSAFAQSLGEQLSGESCAHEWKPQLRALCVLQFLLCKGDLERATAEMVFTPEISEVLNHLAREVPGCREEALRVIELRKLARSLHVGEDAAIGIADDGGIFVVAEAPSPEAPSPCPGPHFGVKRTPTKVDIDGMQLEAGIQFDDMPEAASTEAESVAERKGPSSATSHTSDDDMAPDDVVDVLEECVNAAPESLQSQVQLSTRRSLELSPSSSVSDCWSAANSSSEIAASNNTGRQLDDCEEPKPLARDADDGHRQYDEEDAAVPRSSTDPSASADASEADDISGEVAAWGCIPKADAGWKRDAIKNLVGSKPSSPHAGEARVFEIFTPSSSKSVAVWLQELALERYTEQLVEAGYDDLRILAEVESDEVEEIINLLAMPKGHQRQFKRGLMKLQAAGAEDRRECRAAPPRERTATQAAIPAEHATNSAPEQKELAVDADDHQAPAVDVDDEQAPAVDVDDSPAKASREFEGAWKRDPALKGSWRRDSTWSISNTTLTGEFDSYIVTYTGPDKIEIIVDSNTYTGELNEYGELRWSDGDVWLKAPGSTAPFSDAADEWLSGACSSYSPLKPTEVTEQMETDDHLSDPTVEEVAGRMDAAAATTSDMDWVSGEVVSGQIDWVSGELRSPPAAVENLIDMDSGPGKEEAEAPEIAADLLINSAYGEVPQSPRHSVSNLPQKLFESPVPASEGSSSPRPAVLTRLPDNTDIVPFDPSAASSALTEQSRLDWSPGASSDQWLQSMCDLDEGSLPTIPASSLAFDSNERQLFLHLKRRIVSASSQHEDVETQRKQVPVIPWGVEDLPRGTADPYSLPEVEEPFADLAAVGYANTETPI